MANHWRPVRKFALIIQNTHQLRLNTLRQALVIIVEKGHELTPCLSDNAIARHGNAPVDRIAEHTQLGMLFGQTVKNVTRSIG